MTFDSFCGVSKVLGAGLLGLGLAGPGSVAYSPSVAHAADPNAALTIVNVQCISTSSATDTSSGVLVAAVGTAAAVYLGTGIAGIMVESALVGALAGAGAVQLGSYYPGLDDDLFIRVEGHGSNESLWDSPVRGIGSQETRAINRSFPFDLDEGISITLFDHDVASGNDNLGAIQLNGDTLDRLPFVDEIVVYDEGEGSVYVVSVEIERL